jgi:hypothetical protein
MVSSFLGNLIFRENKKKAQSIIYNVLKEKLIL